MRLKSDLELVWRGVGCLWGVDTKDVCQAASHQEPHVLIRVLEEEIGCQVKCQVKVKFFLLLRVLVHVHESLHHHLHQQSRGCHAG